MLEIWTNEQKLFWINIKLIIFSLTDPEDVMELSLQWWSLCAEILE